MRAIIQKIVERKRLALSIGVGFVLLGSGTILGKCAVTCLPEFSPDASVGSLPLIIGTMLMIFQGRKKK